MSDETLIPEFYDRRCARCKKKFQARRGEPFITCPTCRGSAPATHGGCTRYNIVGSKQCKGYRRTSALYGA